MARITTSLIACLVFGIISAYFLLILWNACQDGMTFFRKLFTGCVAVFAMGTAYMFYDVYRRKSSKLHSYRGVLDHYIALQGIYIFGKIMRRSLDKESRDIRKAQDELIMGRIRTNANTSYGVDHEFSTIKSADEFRLKHPLTRYDHYKDYIDRVEGGEKNVMTSDDPFILGVTSGTSGKSHLIPMIKKQNTHFFTHGISIVFDCMLKQFPGTQNLQRTFKCFYSPKWRTSRGGILIGPNSSSPKTSKHMLNLYTTPLAGFEILSEPEALYVHLLFALIDRDVGTLEANFASLIYTAFVSLKNNWKTLVEDIKLGRVNPDLKIDAEVRANLDKLLKPNPERAAEIRTEFEQGFVGIAKRVWKNLNLVLTVNTGSFELYAKMLQEDACKGIPFYSPLYAATEGLIGLNIWPELSRTRYLLVPKSMFFEFIPIADCDQEQPKTLVMDEVEMNEVYELVISSFGGLYRYRFGDVVRIVDFYNVCPVVEFQYRQGQLLNVRGEKTSEQLFYRALTEVAFEWEIVQLTDYCCVENVLMAAASGEVDPDHTPYYTVFIEVDKPESLTQEQMDMIDQKLQEISYVYMSFRKKGSIGPLRVKVVRPATFLEFRAYMLESTQATSNQYKVPRVLKRKEAVNFLMERVV